MPPRKKELLVNFEEPADKPSSAAPESMVDKAEKTLRTRKKPAAAKQARKLPADPPGQEAPPTPAVKVEELVPQVKLDKKLRKETHSKAEFYIRKDLLERVKTISQEKGKGFKTNLINYALEQALDGLEGSDHSPSAD
ncbi:hypothetical protein ACFOLF_02065 [Paenibacillus sepulcri]|uniref:Uncharacterized protein n=1 Tax=Paenibacillus sepulcri TaxID=359917 RepID=A0ABS7C506_9BACL|nr:hypothetical protein [Paenibacillus sepulcri]